MSENQYTPEERKQIASALKYAKRRLARAYFARAKPLHICYALSESVGADMARAVIMHRLAGAGTVHNWLWQKGLINICNYNKTLVQEYRHRWVDALIKEFSN